MVIILSWLGLVCWQLFLIPDAFNFWGWKCFAFGKCKETLILLVACVKLQSKKKKMNLLRFWIANWQVATWLPNKGICFNLCSSFCVPPQPCRILAPISLFTNALFLYTFHICSEGGCGCLLSGCIWQWEICWVKKGAGCSPLWWGFGKCSISYSWQQDWYTICCLRRRIAFPPGPDQLHHRQG